MAVSPSISVVIAATAGPRHPLPLAGVHEVIAVGRPNDPQGAVSAPFGTPLRQICSDAPAGQRANIGISLASGDWVVVLSGAERLAADWLRELSASLSLGNVCAHRVLPAGGGQPLLAVWRPAFAYGSLDGRTDDVAAAMEQWLTDIFPSHRHRVLPREGSATHRADWLEAGAAPTEAVSSPDRIPPQSGGAYDPRRFWEAGGCGWVKWEAYQPDEPEICAVVEHTQPRRVLELGCGGGRNGRYFAAAERYAGLDISFPLLERARDRQALNSIGLICGDATRLPLADTAFDLVFAVSTFQHIVAERIAACIAEILRVTRRYVCLIEFTDELARGGAWFEQAHMFRHDYAALLAPHAALLLRRPTTLQIQPAVKEMFLFEKRRS
jgi:hypothetical protein